MKRSHTSDLERACRAFDAWRRSRTSRGHIPESLWAHAIALLDAHPITVVCRELRLNPAALRARQKLAVHQPPPPTFVELRGADLATPLRTRTPRASRVLAPEPERVRVTIERADGSRLLLEIADEASRLGTLCQAFVRA